jgi:hypothetical protein
VGQTQVHKTSQLNGTISSNDTTIEIFVLLDEAITVFQREFQEGFDPCTDYHGIMRFVDSDMDSRFEFVNAQWRLGVCHPMQEITGEAVCWTGSLPQHTLLRCSNRWVLFPTFGKFAHSRHHWSIDLAGISLIESFHLDHGNDHEFCPLQVTHLGADANLCMIA